MLLVAKQSWEVLVDFAEAVIFSDKEIMQVRRKALAVLYVLD